jgi:membrane protein insertase Oxa1/YidC/SpoIIIJ
MIPIFIRGAQAQVKLSSVSPELQYLITSFTNDMKTLNAAGHFGSEGSLVKKQVLAAKPRLVRQTLATMRGLLTMKHVNLFDIFKSPILQIPFFVYFASDLRRIIEGSNPALAQQLVESSFFWITDLTEPDPWYGLPIFTGLLLYMNVEIAVGKQSLGGEVSAKSNVAVLLKDGFQSLAIFMPCFMSQQPSGVQLYLATSMIFTLLQSRAMRNDTIRQAVGLPSIHVKPRSMSDSDIVQEFLAKMAERQAAKARGGYILGEGVHVTGANISVPRFGKKRRSSIVVEKDDEHEAQKMMLGLQSESSSSRFVEIKLPEYILRSPLLVQPEMFQSATPIPFQPGFVPGVFRHTSSGTPHSHSMKTDNNGKDAASIMTDIPLSVMEAANRGEKPEEPVVMAPIDTLLRMQEEHKSRKDRPIDADKLKSKWIRRNGKR